ncbi:MAG: PIN domain-containing protein [Actinobacteria bacterium]|nr:PIN domain-containing protein [Actinomycetota bacterium]
MNVLFDTNVILDVLLEREPHIDAASKLFALVDNGRITGSICATTATTVYYIAAKSFGKRRARDQVHGLLGLFEVAPVGRDVLDSALDIDFSDYEDAVLHEAARAAGATVIVTRDRDDFVNSAIPALDPVELLAVVVASG